MSFSTCSWVLWQKEQRNGSSGLNFFTGVQALVSAGMQRSVFNPYSRLNVPLSERKT
jgi:hypothetical protein